SSIPRRAILAVRHPPPLTIKLSPKKPDMPNRSKWFTIHRKSPMDSCFASFSQWLTIQPNSTARDRTSVHPTVPPSFTPTMSRSALPRFISRRGLSPGLRPEESHQSLHQNLRPAEDQRVEAAVSRVVCRLQRKIKR